MSHPSYANVGCASVLFGGLGFVMLLGATEGEQLRVPFLLGALALWAILGFLYWVTYRGHRRQEWIDRQLMPVVAEQALRKETSGGFVKGALWSWLAVLTVHVATFAAASVFDRQGSGILGLLLFFVLPPMHVIVPIIGGVFYSIVRSTSVSRS